MTQHELNIIKLVDLIHDIENTNCHVESVESLNLLNSLVKAHSDATGTEYIEYDQTPVEPPRDYAG